MRILEGCPRIECPYWSPARGTPEDVGGVWGFFNLPEAASNPEWDGREEWPEKDEMEAFDPDDFDEESTRDRIASAGQTRRRPRTMELCGNLNSSTRFPPVCKDARELSETEADYSLVRV